jgi:hypothetical protein
MSAEIVRLPSAVPSPRSRFICERESLGQIPAADEPILAILDSWRRIRGDGKVPPPSGSMSPEVHLRPLIGYIHVVDCTASNPLDYAFRLFGSSITLFGERDFTRRRVGELPDEGWARQTAEDYQRVALAGCPSFHKIVLQHNFLSRQYTRLILPFANAGREVNRLVVCLNRRPLPELGPLPG